jgi:hypothetical protein
VKLECYSVERVALLSGFTGHVNTIVFRKGTFSEFEEQNYVINQAGRSAIASEAEEDLEVNLLCLKGYKTEVCVYLWKCTLSRLFIFLTYRRSHSNNSSVTCPQSDIIVT